MTALQEQWQVSGKPSEIVVVVVVVSAHIISLWFLACPTANTVG